MRPDGKHTHSIVEVAWGEYIKRVYMMSYLNILPFRSQSASVKHMLKPLMTSE